MSSSQGLVGLKAIEPFLEWVALVLGVIALVIMIYLLVKEEVNL